MILIILIIFFPQFMHGCAELESLVETQHIASVNWLDIASKFLLEHW